MGAFIRWLFLGVVLLGCNRVGSPVAGGEDAIQGAGQGTLIVRAIRAPVSPVEGIPGARESEPAAGVTFLISRLSGSGTDRETTDRNGEFRKRLPAGLWRVDLAERPAVGGSKDLPKTVAVEVGGETRIEIRIDTGIR